jgi:hypothetical protein
VLWVDLGPVRLGCLDPKPEQEFAHPRRHPRILELVGEHRGDGHRQVAGDLEQRQVGAHRGVEQPLLAERVCAEPLDVGHV